MGSRKPRARDRATGLLAAGAGLLLLFPLTGPDAFILDVLTVGFLLAVFVGSWDVVGGVAGQISLGHSLCFGTATYACALLTNLCGWPFPLAAAGALLLSAAAGAVLGTASSRLKGPFVALLTLSLGELFHEAALGRSFLSPGSGYSWGGEGGVPVALPWTDGAPLPAYYAALLFLFLSTLFLLRLARSEQGLIWKALAGSELTARASGVDVGRHKRRAFLVGGALAGAAGVGFAAHVGRATASDFSLELSFQAATFAAIGGRGTVTGPILSALLFHVLFQGLRIPPEARVLLYASVLLLTLRFLPGGAAGLLRDTARRAASSMDKGRNA